MVSLNLPVSSQLLMMFVLAILALFVDQHSQYHSNGKTGTAMY